MLGHLVEVIDMTDRGEKWHWEQRGGDGDLAGG